MGRVLLDLVLQHMGFTLFVLVLHRSLTSRDDMTLLLTLVANGILPAAVGRLVLDTSTITVPTPLPRLALRVALRVALLIIMSVTVALLITTSVTLPLPRHAACSPCAPHYPAQTPLPAARPFPWVSQASLKVRSAVLNRRFWIFSWFKPHTKRSRKALLRYTPKLQ